MARGRWSSSLGCVYRWWKYEQETSRMNQICLRYLVIKQVGFTKLTGYRLLPLVEPHVQLNFSTIRTCSKPHTESKRRSGSLVSLSYVGKSTAKIMLTVQLFPAVLPGNVEDGGVKWDQTVISRVRVFLASRRSPSYAEGLPVVNCKGSTSGSEKVYFTRHAIADAVAKAAPAVVNITVSIGGRISFAQTAGSGFIIHPDGTILTNAHVVADESVGPYKGKIVVTMQDGRNFPGEIVSYDVLADIAVIKVHSNKPLPAVEFGSSRKLRPGEWVVAVGSPLHLQNSVTVGIVSCVDRKSAEMGLRGVHADYIQTDAAINQGNSGGPLLNLDGEVIGINTMKALAADGVSFAIPIDNALRIVQQLKKHGHVVRPWLGMKMLGLTEDIITQLKERDSSFPDVKTGVFVPKVIPGSPAERAGVLAGDVIVEFDGRSISTPYEIVEALEDKVGVPFKLLIRRGQGSFVTLYVITEEASPNL